MRSAVAARGADPAKEGIPATHDVPKLGIEAGPPELPPEDKHRLLLVKSVLVWSGRYPTPKSAEAREAENKALEALKEPAVGPQRMKFENQSVLVGQNLIDCIKWHGWRVCELSEDSLSIGNTGHESTN